jgi:Leucine-rich repeat (LRR) protein
MLGNVNTLDLTGTKITDVSKLRNVKRLYLSGCVNLKYNYINKVLR